MSKTACPYTLVVAEPFLCVAACISMVLDSVGRSMPQRTIAESLGVVIPEMSSKCETSGDECSIVHRVGIRLDADAINRFLRSQGMSLRAEFFNVRTLQDWQFEEMLSGSGGKPKHVICGYDYDRLSGRKSSGIGHAALVLGAYAIDMVQLLDPGTVDAGIKTVWISDLRSAALARYGGLLVLA